MQDAATILETAGRTIEMIGVGSGLGASVSGCGRGPEALYTGGLEGWLRARGLVAGWREIITPRSGAAGAVSVAVAELCERVAAAVEAALDRESRVVVLGGDHSCAIGTWSGAARSVRRRGPLGLVWIDAHMDSHLPETSPSGSYHGMPLACLLGFGEARLTGIAGTRPAVAPGDVCLLGVRSYEREERDLLDRLGVRVIAMDEVARRGVEAALREAFRIAGGGTAALGVSIDLDALDPRDAPGVGSPVAGGLRAAELVSALERVGREVDVAAVEIAEFNPEVDRGGATHRVVRDLLAAMHRTEDRDG